MQEVIFLKDTLLISAELIGALAVISGAVFTFYRGI